MEEGVHGVTLLTGLSQLITWCPIRVQPVLTAVYLYSELEMADCRQLRGNLKHWNTPAHCAVTEGPNQHPALIDTDTYKLLDQ